ncbi:MAG: FISUMP domain-containing protein [Melioribacteraceae bacterium]|nr:FISUMP domain-containing protein [Melioribacteraceae bacterium]
MKLGFLISALFSFSSLVFSQNPCPKLPAVNYGGKIYNTVHIGSQCWLKENLDIGTMIPVNQDGSNNGSIEKYCYNNDINNCNVYGGLYQWNEVMQYASTPGSKGICSTGWHIPTIEEFQSLANMVQNDGNALKAIGQGTGNGSGTNTSGFSALLSGYRGNDGQSYYIGSHSRFWGSIENINFGANIIHLYYNVGNIGFGDGYKEFGYSVRCVNDNIFTSVFEELNQNQIPEGYSISQNYPNPFNPITLIKYSIPKFCHVTIKLFDLLGKEILLLIDEDKNPGNYEIYINGKDFASGIYYYKINAGEFLQSKKMVLLK